MLCKLIKNTVRNCECVSAHLTGAEGRLPPLLSHFPSVQPLSICFTVLPQQLNSTEVDVDSLNIDTFLVSVFLPCSSLVTPDLKCSVIMTQIKVKSLKSDLGKTS